MKKSPALSVQYMRGQIDAACFEGRQAISHTKESELNNVGVEGERRQNRSISESDEQPMGHKNAQHGDTEKTVCHRTPGSKGYY